MPWHGRLEPGIGSTDQTEVREGVPALSVDLESALLDLLWSRPQGWREFDLLATLEEGGQPGFESGRDHSRVGLFRRHFRLFHALYGLRDRLRREAAADLRVHCVDIRIVAYQNPDRRLPAELDGVREYYRDPCRADALTEQEVEVLIRDGLERVVARERRHAALLTLDLSDPVSSSDIRRRFHALALQHHPDLGGDPRRFQEISAAAAQLR